jgi:hypothetical protein
MNNQSKKQWIKPSIINSLSLKQTLGLNGSGSDGMPVGSAMSATS